MKFTWCFLYIWHKAQQIVNSLSFCPVLYISIHLFERVKWQMGMANGNPNNLSTLADSVIYLKSFISFHFISAWEDHQIRSSLGILLVSALLNWWSFILNSFSFLLSLSLLHSFAWTKLNSSYSYSRVLYNYPQWILAEQMQREIFDMTWLGLSSLQKNYEFRLLLTTALSRCLFYRRRRRYCERRHHRPKITNTHISSGQWNS